MNTYPQFPCAVMPEETRSARLLGLYSQRQEGLLMQRVRIPAGRLSLDQWKAMAELALRHTPLWPLHLTTRQDIEFHGVKPGEVPALQQGLSKAGLTTLGAGGDTLRNLTVCPCGGMKPGTFDLAPLADAVYDFFRAQPWVYGLPRKFKISFSGCSEGCARPWINDVGIVANPDGSLRAILAGSLGPRPATGVLCYERLNARAVLLLITAALRLFNAEGDRQNRGRARLRHVRERLGGAAFKEKLDTLFEEEKLKEYPAPSEPVRYNGPSLPIVRAQTPNGDVDPEYILDWMDLFEPLNASLRIGFEHDLYIFGIDAASLTAPLSGWVYNPRIAACPGAHNCSRGITTTWDVAEAIREILPAECDLSIGISGCPNNCSQGPISDIGLIGRVIVLDTGERRPHFRLLAGGGKGASPALAIELNPGVPQESVAQTVRWLVDEWMKATRHTPISFSSFIAAEKERLIRESPLR